MDLRRGRPALQWRWVLDWVRDNPVPDDLFMADDDGRDIVAVRWAERTNRLYLTAHFVKKRPPLTWRALKAAVEEIAPRPNAELWFDGENFIDDARVVDLGWGEEKGEPFVLQRRWG